MKAVEAIRNDITFLINVLKISSNHTIDLTPLMFNVIESTQQCYYELSKRLLPLRREKWVSKSAIEILSISWIYHPIQELLRLKIQIDDSKTNKNNETTLFLNHLTLGKLFVLILVSNPKIEILNVDLDSSMGKGGRNLMSLVTMYKMYRLLPALLGFGINCEGALHEAVS